MNQVYQVFVPREVRVLQALALTFFPQNNSIGLDGLEAGVPLYLDGYFSRFPWFFQVGFRIFLRVLDWLPILFLRSFRTLKRMSPEKINRFLNGWSESRWYLRRLSFLGIKLIFSTAYFNHPEVWKQIGYYEVCPPKKEKSS